MIPVTRPVRVVRLSAADLEREKLQVYGRALERAGQLLDLSEDLEPTSALKQAASDEGIEWGSEMGAFVTWAYAQWKKGV